MTTDEAPILDDEGIDRERWRITDDRSATWALKKLRSINKKRDEFKQIAADEIAGITRWLEEALDPFNRDATFFEAVLSHYAIDCRDNPEDGRKTISLPFGKVSTRQGRDRWEIEDVEFIEWAKKHLPTAIRIKEEIAKDVVKDQLMVVNEQALLDGEIVPGVKVTTTGISVSIQTTD